LLRISLKEMITYSLSESLFLSDWDGEFLLSLNEKINRGSSLSAKEQDILELIFEKIVGRNQ
jgi:hypothetical protein